MPRNQSEQVVRCPEAHRYAHYCEKLLSQRGRYIFDLGEDEGRRMLWRAIPDTIREELWKALPDRLLRRKDRRAVLFFYARYIREHYAA